MAMPCMSECDRCLSQCIRVLLWYVFVSETLYVYTTSWHSKEHWMFSAASVFLFLGLCLCQHDKFQMSIHRMMNLGEGVGALYKNFDRVLIWGS